MKLYKIFISINILNFDSLEAVKATIGMILEDWLKPNNQQEINTMVTWTRRAHIIIICGYSTMIVACVFFIFLPFFKISITNIVDNFDTDRMLPLPVYHIYGLKKWPQYELTYVVQIIVILCIGMTFTGIDNFLGLLVFHICGQLDILRIRLIFLNKLIKSYDLRSCVITHIRILRYSVLYLILHIF